LLFKNALMDRSRTIFSGLIIVEEDAQQTDAYQTNNNLMISDEAEANSLPGLEIGANDVKCSHGATTGRIDQSELFYFLARGIPATKARELMVFGYFEEIIAKLPDAQLADFVRELVQHKFVD
jgi:Fe-S cluster assembly protein SufD